MDNKKSYREKDLISTISFYAVVFSGIAIFISKLFVKLNLFAQIATLCDTIASLLVYFVVAVSAFFYIRGKKVVYFVLYFICIALIIIAYVLPIF